MEVGDRRVTLASAGHVAAVVVDELSPATAFEVVVDGRRLTTATTLAPPPGRLRSRVATVSDIHVGDGWTFGVLPTVHDGAAAGETPVVRATRAAVDELTRWRPDLLVGKGDLTHHGHPEEWRSAAGLLTGTGLPVIATVGNHDVRREAVDGRPHMAEAGIDLALRGIVVRDLPGIRVVAVDATMPARHPGSFRASGRALLDAVGDAPGPVLVAVHHQFQRLPVPTHWPPGVLGPESGRFLRKLAAANRNVLVTSGHTHRNRARVLHGVVVTEVGSPKDHPGAWGGYAVHEGGIRQVVRRVADPDTLRWTEATRRALFGIWGRWSPGRLADRCFTHHWS